MRAEDLRIGNYIIYQKEHIIKCDLKDIELSEIDREPIPLTEEILLKCGFEKINVHKDPNMYVYCVEGLEYLHTVDNGVNFFISAFNETTVKYVHQLQNWYYLAIEGKELNVKL